MFSWLPKGVRRDLRGHWKRIHASYARRVHAFTRRDLLRLLAELSMKMGDVVMVHSSFDKFEGFTGKPADILSALQEAVGPQGTILMPTMPFTGSAVEYVAQGQVFDVRRTPSRMGLLTELFRRTPGVLRSVHPTHSVAAWGAKARVLIAGHHLTDTPCGRGTPYARLLEHDGKLLFLGTNIEVMTFFHAVEEFLAPTMPFSPFTEEVFTLSSRTVSGEVVDSRVRLFAPYYSRRRRIVKLVPTLKERDCWLERRLGGIRSILLRAADVLAAAEFLASHRIYCYDV